MKKFLLFTATLALLLLTGCMSRTEKADVLIDDWMSKNLSEATYGKVLRMTSTEFSLEERQRIALLQEELDSARVYYEFFVDKEVINDPAFAKTGIDLSGISENMNNLMKEAAEERTYYAKVALDEYKYEHAPKKMGDKGYYARVKYKLKDEDKTLIFYFDKEIEKILDVEYRE